MTVTCVALWMNETLTISNETIIIYTNVMRSIIKYEATHMFNKESTYEYKLDTRALAYQRQQDLWSNDFLSLKQGQISIVD